MPTALRPPGDVACPSAADINAQIRALSVGRAVWTDAARAEWAALTAEWQAAVEREQELAA